MFIFDIFSADTQKHKVPYEEAFYLVSKADFWCNLQCISNPIRSRGFRGPPWLRRA